MHEKAVIDRLRAMQLENRESSDEGYVLVGNGKPTETLNEKALGALKLARQPGNISVSQMQQWQSHLLQDPKNRYEILHSASCVSMGSNC